MTARAKARLGDRVFRAVAMGAGVSILVALAAVAIFLIARAMPALVASPAELERDGTDFWPYVPPLIFGTVWAAFLALLFALPLAVGIALFISHYAPRKLAQGLGYAIDLLAAIVTEAVAIQGRTLPRGFAWTTLAASVVASAAVFLALALARVTPEFNVAAAAVVGAILYLVLVGVISRLVEGRRKSVDRVMTGVITAAFLIALIPLISLVATTAADGISRLDIQFFSSSMLNVVGAGGGGPHAIIGTLLVTGAALLISVPVGIMTAIYLVEYGKGRLAKSITFLIDVMTGIPSIVAGLFAFALFALIFGPGIRFGFGGAVALSLLMIPVVVRSTEEMLKLVPNELREASFALGVPKWLTIVKVVLPTAIAGIITGVMISIARIIGETAPLLIIAGLSTSMNYDLFSERMTTLPVFVYTQYTIQGADAQAYIDRAWTGALVLIIIVLLLNLIARILSRVLAPKGSR